MAKLSFTEEELKALLVLHGSLRQQDKYNALKSSGFNEEAIELVNNITYKFYPKLKDYVNKHIGIDSYKIVKGEFNNLSDKETI